MAGCNTYFVCICSFVGWEKFIFLQTVIQNWGLLASFSRGAIQKQWYCFCNEGNLSTGIRGVGVLAILLRKTKQNIKNRYFLTQQISSRPSSSSHNSFILALGFGGWFVVFIPAASVDLTWLPLVLTLQRRPQNWNTEWATQSEEDFSYLRSAA